ncbi:hypothetical protein K440DRAFT_550172 [Wilcoxina mikolae CBS 423.85]|nr:hypothetical protein K440DRAFT_550172 [Wilcoxina mikolae CBS 423.85]
MPQFEKGDRVEYHPIGGRHGTSTSTGTIERVLTEPDTAGSQHQHINASKEEPRYEVCNEHTGKTSAIKQDNIEKVLD